MQAACTASAQLLNADVHMLRFPSPVKLMRDPSNAIARIAIPRRRGPMQQLLGQRPARLTRTCCVEWKCTYTRAVLSCGYRASSSRSAYANVSSTFNGVGGGPHTSVDVASTRRRSLHQRSPRTRHHNMTHHSNPPFTNPTRRWARQERCAVRLAVATKRPRCSEPNAPAASPGGRCSCATTAAPAIAPRH